MSRTSEPPPRGRFAPPRAQIVVDSCLALVLALVVSYLVARPATGERTYGLLRAEVLGAFVNGASLVLIVGLERFVPRMPAPLLAVVLLPIETVAAEAFSPELHHASAIVLHAGPPPRAAAADQVPATAVALDIRNEGAVAPPEGRKHRARRGQFPVDAALAAVLSRAKPTNQQTRVHRGVRSSNARVFVPNGGSMFGIRRQNRWPSSSLTWSVIRWSGTTWREMGRTGKC